MSIGSNTALTYSGIKVSSLALCKITQRCLIIHVPLLNTTHNCKTVSPEIVIIFFFVALFWLGSYVSGSLAQLPW